MSPIFCGIDVGGTKLSAALVDADGRVLCSRLTTAHTDLDEGGLVNLIDSLVRELCAERDVGVASLAGVGVAMAGHVSHRRGVVLTTSNLRGFKNFPLAEALSRRLGVRVVLDNDANCQALAEHRFGAGSGYSDMVFFTISTGIGAGLILNGKLYRGHSGTAGELGHAIIEPRSGVRCACGNHGCFMAHACTLNLADAVGRLAPSHPESALPGLLPAIDGKAIRQHALRGDSLARAIVEEYAGYISILLYNTFQVLNPQAFVMGGGLMHWGGEFFERIEKGFFDLAGAMLFDPVSVVAASMGADGGVIGAAQLPRDFATGS